MSSPGHNLSRVDTNSAEGESGSIRNQPQTDNNIYRNYDQMLNRPKRINSSQIPCLPVGEGHPVPSPPSQRRLLELEAMEQQEIVGGAPISQDETQLLPSSPSKGFISPDVSLMLNVYICTRSTFLMKMHLKRFVHFFL